MIKSFTEELKKLGISLKIDSLANLILSTICQPDAIVDIKFREICLKDIGIGGNTHLSYIHEKAAMMAGVELFDEADIFPVIKQVCLKSGAKMEAGEIFNLAINDINGTKYCLAIELKGGEFFISGYLPNRAWPSSSIFLFKEVK